MVSLPLVAHHYTQSEAGTRIALNSSPSSVPHSALCLWPQTPRPSLPLQCPQTLCSHGLLNSCSYRFVACRPWTSRRPPAATPTSSRRRSSLHPTLRASLTRWVPTHFRSLPDCIDTGPDAGIKCHLGTSSRGTDSLHSTPPSDAEAACRTACQAPLLASSAKAHPARGLTSATDLSQSYSVVSGAAWIGLNSIANPGAQAWHWAGGQNYDPSVQVS